MNDMIAKQRNRQLEVKKNEEYQALENEIANLQSKIEERENEQIETLLKIDGARETAELAQGKISERVREMEQQREMFVTPHMVFLVMAATVWMIGIVVSVIASIGHWFLTRRNINAAAA